VTVELFVISTAQQVRQVFAVTHLRLHAVIHILN